MLGRLLLLTAASVALAAGSAQAASPDYVFEGGTVRQQAQVRAALQASSFDWSLLPERITVHISSLGTSRATPGHVWLSARLLDTGRFSWATVLDEFAHQLDYQLFDLADRARLWRQLGGTAWCYETPTAGHSANACERFASVFAWAYWPSPHNAYRPMSGRDESAAMPATLFRSLLTEILREG